MIVDAGSDGGIPVGQEVCTDFRTGPHGWTLVGEGVKQTDQGFVFTLGAQRKGIAQGFVSAAEIRTSKVRLDWSFDLLSSLALNASILLMTQNYGTQVAAALQTSGGDVRLTGNNGSGKIDEVVKSTPLPGTALDVFSGNDVHFDTSWAASGSVAISGGSASSSVQAATLNPETRRRDFILDIGGTASGITGVTVTIRQACVSFE